MELGEFLRRDEQISARARVESGLSRSSASAAIMNSNPRRRRRLRDRQKKAETFKKRFEGDFTPVVIPGQPLFGKPSYRPYWPTAEEMPEYEFKRQAPAAPQYQPQLPPTAEQPPTIRSMPGVTLEETEPAHGPARQSTTRTYAWDPATLREKPTVRERPWATTEPSKHLWEKPPAPAQPIPSGVAGVDPRSEEAPAPAPAQPPAPVLDVTIPGPGSAMPKEFLAGYGPKKSLLKPKPKPKTRELSPGQPMPTGFSSWAKVPLADIVVHPTHDAHLAIRDKPVPPRDPEIKKKAPKPVDLTRFPSGLIYNLPGEQEKMYRDRGITPPQPQLALTGTRLDEVLRKKKLKDQQDAAAKVERHRAEAEARIKRVRKRVAAKAPILPPKPISLMPTHVPLSSRTHDVISIAEILQHEEEVKQARLKGLPPPPTAHVTVPLRPVAPALTVVGGHVVIQGSKEETAAEEKTVASLVAAGTTVADVIQAPQSTSAREAEIHADTQRKLAEQMRLAQLEKDEQAKDDAEALQDLRKTEEVALASRAIINRDLAKTISPYSEYSQSQLDALKQTNFDAWATELSARKKKRLAATLEQFMAKDYGKSNVSDKRKREIQASVAVSAEFERGVRAKRQKRLVDTPITEFTAAERDRQQRQRELTGKAAAVGTRAAAATRARETGELRATETGAKAAATREQTGAAKERAATSAVESAKKTFMALSPLDSGAMKPPESIKNDQAVIQRADENRELLKNAKSEGTGQSYDSPNDLFDAFVDQSTTRKELEKVIHRIRPLLTKGGHTAAGRRDTIKLRKRLVKLNRRLDKVISGHITRSVTSGLKRASPTLSLGKRTKPREKKKPKVAKSSKRPRRTNPKAGGFSSKKTKGVKKTTQPAGHERYFI